MLDMTVGMSLTRALCSLVLLLCLTNCASRAVDVKPSSSSDCAKASLFERFARGGMVASLAGGDVRLSVMADVHSADCGTPDCYFTRLQAVFRFEAGQGCRLREVDVFTEDGGCNVGGAFEPPKQETFFPDGAADLSAPTLGQLTLRTRQGDRALVLVPRNLFYFADVKPGAPLHTSLPADAEGEDACCWGASVAESHFRD
ncbi:hypothetical protein VZQ01_43075 [Myxococcus faecalis]|uniref:hypothetical protein n=1 Tax=Myxococcus TaxID=32 RepID=UPI001CBE3FE1|nr:MULTISPECIES: hypothetical protein [unclassified Myxococcus]MBZ4399470.1 hypothetical protein [Myxococcus sp. AS-1-15]MBZ4412249.1 hypothetical protein [Myxococcus sp. XM-1-1-1]BDT34259.1 hypothetical protein MFMH1_39280 [Myxococcus sp. MH1]